MKIVSTKKTEFGNTLIDFAIKQGEEKLQQHLERVTGLKKA
jgi:hypothetical protein